MFTVRLTELIAKWYNHIILTINIVRLLVVWCILFIVKWIWVTKFKRTDEREFFIMLVLHYFYGPSLENWWFNTRRIIVPQLRYWSRWQRKWSGSSFMVSGPRIADDFGPILFSFPTTGVLKLRGNKLTSIGKFYITEVRRRRGTRQAARGDKWSRQLLGGRQFRWSLPRRRSFGQIPPLRAEKLLVCHWQGHWP